ncbi:sulfatase-like hydrolase/transferase [Micromonospora sp. NPDC003197]
MVGDVGSAPVRRFTERRAALEIVGLCGLAITQPVLDVTGRSPDFFLFHGAAGLDVLLFVAVCVLPPPLLLWGIGVLTRLAGPAIRSATHTATVGLLLAALALQVVKHLLPLRGVPLVLAALAVGVAGGYAHRRWSAPGQLLRFASVGPLIFVLVFVLVSPASAVVLPRERGGSGPGFARSAGHPPVVLIVLDELPLVSLLGPDGRIDANRFPHFARLAGQSTWYRNATAVSGWTPYALPAMLTGRYPTETGAPHYSTYPDNLFTLLGGRYDIRAQESIAQLCPPSRCARSAPAGPVLPTLLREGAGLLGQVLSPTDDDRDPTASYREVPQQEAERDRQQSVPTDPRFRWDTLDDNQPARFTDFLAGLRAGRTSVRPTLDFLHLLMPHSPWSYLPSGVRYDAPADLANDGAGWVTLASDRHLAQLGYTDRLIGETLRTLEETGSLDEALVVVTADHGVSFTPQAQGRGLEAVRRSPGEVLWVPMFVKEPGQRVGRVDDRNWEHVDLLPTIADLVDIEVPWRVDGVSAVSGGRDRSEKYFYDQPGKRIAVPGPETFAAVVGATVPPPVARSELLGRAVTDFAVVETGVSAQVANLAALRGVDPAEGKLPALLHGTVPATVPDGTRLVIAVNGRIGAVVPVVAPDSGGRRFAALVSDDALFNPGVNRLELFTRIDGQETLGRLRL